MIDYKKQRLLVIAPHPDDEVIGCGGLMKKIKNAGGKVYVLFLTVGDTNDFSKKGLSTAKKRVKEIENVSRFLEYDNFDIALAGNDKHLQLDLVGQKKLMDIIERTSAVAVEKVKPTIVAFPSPFSYNQDHRIAAASAHASVRPSLKDYKWYVSTVLAYEEPADNWTLHKKQDLNLYIPLSKNELRAKLKSLKLYTSQFRKSPSLRSEKTLEVLAVLRGAQCGVDFAEAFTIYREVMF